MTNAASNTSTAKPETAAQTNQVILKEVGAKWGKFSEQDLSALKGKDDLVNQVVAKGILEFPYPKLGVALMRFPTDSAQNQA
jgi:hypothetical protein